MAPRLPNLSFNILFCLISSGAYSTVGLGRAKLIIGGEEGGGGVKENNCQPPLPFFAKEIYIYIVQGGYNKKILVFYSPLDPIYFLFLFGPKNIKGCFQGGPCIYPSC